MKVFNSIFIGLSFALLGCERPSVSIQGLPFPGSPAPAHDSGPPVPDTLTNGWIESSKMDDGFGASVAYGDRQIWIGAPFGEQGNVYRWVAPSVESVLMGPAGKVQFSMRSAWAEGTDEEAGEMDEHGEKKVTKGIFSI